MMRQASRCPQRPSLAALISVSISAGVKYSPLRRLALGCLIGMIRASMSWSAAREEPAQDRGRLGFRVRSQEARRDEREAHPRTGLIVEGQRPRDVTPTHGEGKNFGKSNLV